VRTNALSRKFHRVPSLHRQPARSRTYRHRGFLSASRSSLAAGAFLATGLLASVPALPANADAFETPQAAVKVQSFRAASAVQDVSVSRDAFDVTAFSLVQYPVPASTPISSDFGFRVCPGCDANHTGTDFNPGNGYPIVAIADGIVAEVSFDGSGAGQYVVVEHVIDGEIVRSLYGHMQSRSQTVAVGDSVLRGQQLGVVGSTGQATGPHLHLEIITSKGQIDPEPWLLAHVNS